MNTDKKAEYNKRWREKRRAEGRCVRCGEKVSTKEDGTPYWQCDKCREKDRAQYRDARKNDYCIICGKRTSGYCYCEKCRERAKILYMERKRTRK